MIYKNLKGYWSFVYGKAEADYEQVAFDLILSNFNLQNYNIVKVSSILPKGFVYKEVIEDLPEEGEVLYMAYIWRFFQKEDLYKNFDKKYSAGILVVEPKDKSKVGLILELENFLEKEQLEKELIKQVNHLLAIRKDLQVLDIKKKVIETGFCIKVENNFVFKPFGVLVGVVLW